MPDDGDPLYVTIVANDIRDEGGMERQLTELIEGLLERGNRVTVISWTCTLSPHKNLRWIRVRGPTRPFALAYPIFFALASLLLWRYGRGIRHSTGAIVLNRVDIFTVHFCHRAFSELPPFSRASQGGLPYELNARVSRTMSRLAEAWCYRPCRARYLVGVSEGVTRELCRHFPNMAARTTVIPNGVDTDEFLPPRARNRTQGPVRALFVGSEWERKGLGIAIEALRSAPDVTLMIVGDGDERSYASHAVDCGVADRVSFVGPTADVAPWFRGADVFLLPTAYETFSLVTYEAAACGLPLLVTKVNGVEELLRDGENGWFVRRDPHDVGEKLVRLVADPELRMKMGESARRSTLEYSWLRVVDRYEDLYSHLGR